MEYYFQVVIQENNIFSNACADCKNVLLRSFGEITFALTQPDSADFLYLLFMMNIHMIQCIWLGIRENIMLKQGPLFQPALARLLSKENSLR